MVLWVLPIKSLEVILWFAEQLLENVPGGDSNSEEV